MEFKKKGAWKLGRSVLRKGTSPGGQIIWKGEAVLYEENDEGERERKQNVHKFLIRIGKKRSQIVEGTKEDATKALLRMLATSGQTTPLNGGRIKLKKYLREDFLPGCRGRKLAPKTCRHYDQDCENHIIPALGDLWLGRISAKDIRKFLRNLRAKGLSPRHVKNIYGCLRVALNEAVANELIDSHHATPEKINIRKITRPSKRERVERSRRKRLLAWARDEVLHFLRLAPRDNELTRVAFVGCRTGMRPGELCARTWTDLADSTLNIWTAVFENDKKAREEDAELLRWEIGPIKNGKERVLLLDQESLAVLEQQRKYVHRLFREGKITAEAAEYIFPAQAGENPFSNPDNMYERWRFFVTGNKNKRVEKRDPRLGGRPPRQPLEGVRFISLYGFRHTCATEMIRQNVPVPVIAERLGTSEEMIHRHYGHVLKEMQAEAVESLPSYGFMVAIEAS